MYPVIIVAKCGMNEDWDVLDPNNLVMDMVITDIGVLAKKERVPAEYTLVSHCLDSLSH